MSDSTATQRSTGARAVLLVDVPSPPSLPPSPCPLYEFAGLTLPPPPPARRSRAPTRRRAVAHKTIVLSSSPTKACLSLLWSSFSCLSSSLFFSSIFLFSFFFIVFYLPMFSSRPFPPPPFASSVFSSSSMLTSNLSPCFFGFRLLEVPLLRLLHSFLSVVLSLFCCPCLLLLIFSLPLPFVLFGFLPTTFLCFRTVLPPCFLRFAAWPSPLRLRANLFRDERHSVAPFTVTRP